MLREIRKYEVRKKNAKQQFERTGVEKLFIDYRKNDRVVVNLGESRATGTVKYRIDRGSEKFEYGILIDGELCARRFHHGAIIKQADSGGMGKVHNIENI